MAAKQLEGKLDGFGSVGIAAHTTVTIEIGAQSHMVDTHHIDGMFQMFDSVDDGGFAFRAKETMIKRGMSHATGLSQSPKLVVGQIAGMVTKGAAVAMTAHNRRT